MINIRISADSKGWLLETLRDLAPVKVAQAMIEAGVVGAPEGLLHQLPDHGAQWTDEADREDAHANMGVAVEGIVAELTAKDDGLESLAARLYTHVATNGQEFDAAALIDEFNELIDKRYPDGHGGLF